MRRALSAIVAAGLLAGGLTATATAADPTTTQAAEPGSSTVVPLQVTGDPENRFNMVFLGDGYTEEELPKFREELDEHLNIMWSLEPFRTYRNYINVYAVEIVSAESGIDCDDSLDSPRVDTPLNMGLWGGCNPNSVQRLLTMDSRAARTYAQQAPKVDQVVALGNSDTYGGAGGSYATATGGNAMSALITPHEIAHSLGNLQDEYDYYTRGITTGDYTGREPSSIHHTIMSVEEMAERQVKWWRWLGEESESGGTIGAYEGGMYYSTGIYRPSQHSMMKSLGYYMDQVSRERMTERISAQIALIEDSTPADTAPGRTDVLWIETAQPKYHDLDISWTVNGQPVPEADGSHQLDLAEIGARQGDDVSVTVVDPTEFVRDPALRAGPGLTATREWTVGAIRPRPTRTTPEITNHTPNESAVGGEDVVFVHTNHVSDRDFDITWSIDGEVVSGADGRTFDIGAQDLPTGTYELSVKVTDTWPSRPGSATMSWTIDNTPATVELTLSEPLSVETEAGEPPHYTFRESFTMGLEAEDDQPGHVVREFRLNGDGWHHYYGWPTDKELPFLFTPTGTNVDDLVYGNLGTGGMSLSPFQLREPGYGTHTIEYRTIDAAGNISEAGEFTVTVIE